VTRRPYAKILDTALKPFGFARKGLDWTRVRGDLEETVNLQPSWLGGRTVNLYVKDLETEKLFLEIFGSEGAIRMPPISARVGQLIDNRDHWWGDEPNGPERMAESTVRFGLPWFDKVRTPEEQAANWYGRYSKDTRSYYVPGMIGLALTLYRMGELAEACLVLNAPVPRTANAEGVRKIARVREWLGCAHPDAKAGSAG